MILNGTSQEKEKSKSKSKSKSFDPASNPSASTAISPNLSFQSPSSSSSSPRFRSSPLTKLRFHQLVQPLTPTELVPSHDIPQTPTGKARERRLDEGSSGVMQYPRVELSSLDLAKPRIYTRLLYFFESNDSQGSSSPISSYPTSGTSAAASSSSSPPSSTTASASSSAFLSSSSPTLPKKAAQKSRHHYHYHQSPFMDPMLLQASLALVLTDFYPLAGRLCGSNSKNQYIECNDRGVLFTVADTAITMQSIRQGGYQDSVLPPRLFPVGLYPASLRDPPLLGIQLTYTQDHSLIMGVAVDTSVMDGISLVSFMDAWAKITQGKDFDPYPVLDRKFLEKYGEDFESSGVYRHQRLNNSPPPPILFDNGIENDFDRGLGDSDQQSDDEDDEYDNSEYSETDERTRTSDNLEQAQRRMLSLNRETIPSVVVDGADRLEAPIDELSDFSRFHLESGSVIDSEDGNLHLFHFTSEQLKRIKKLASEQNIAAAACAADDKEISDKWVSTGDSLIAYLWKMSTITRRMEPDCKLMCGVVMDIRSRLTPTIPRGFIGNAIISISVQMPVHSLLTTPLSLPSRLLRDELLLQTADQIRSSINWIQKQEHPQLIESDSSNPFGDDFVVWSFRKLNMYSPDFGQGKPRKVRIGRGGFRGGEGMCIIMDSEPIQRGHLGSSNGPDGATKTCGVDVYLGLQGEHLQDFEKIHREFMEGLIDHSGQSNDWEVV